MEPILLQNPKFPTGRIVITRNAQNVIPHEDYAESLRRHLLGDWGELCEEDRQLNDMALLKGGRLLSSYRSSKQVKFWIITEADHSATTILLPEDY